MRLAALEIARQIVANVIAFQKAVSSQLIQKMRRMHAVPSHAIASRWKMSSRRPHAVRLLHRATAPPPGERHAPFPLQSASSATRMPPREKGARAVRNPPPPVVPLERAT